MKEGIVYEETGKFPSKETFHKIKVMGIKVNFPPLQIITIDENGKITVSKV